MWRPLVVTCTESCYVPIREKNSRFPALSEQWSHGCHGKDTKPEHFVSQRRNIHVNFFFFFFNLLCLHNESKIKKNHDEKVDIFV